MDETTARARLRSERARAHHERQRVADTYLSVSQSELTDSLSAYDNHPADAAPSTLVREEAVGEIQRWRARAQAVEDALERLRRGRWGRCVDCGGPIPAARLEAIPWAARCRPCEERQDERQHPAGPNEEALSPPFGRTFLDSTGDVEVDGEDTWQAVARMGTSDSPQDAPPARDVGDAYVDADENRGSWDLGMHVEETNGANAATEHPDAG